MGADFVIRAATEADVPALAQIHVDDWRWAYRGLERISPREARYLIEFPG
jgi:hypothetical protein